MLKWIATNGPGGGFWEEVPDSQGNTTTNSTGYNPQSSTNTYQANAQPITIQDQNFNNPFIQGSLNQGNTKAAQSFIDVENARTAADKAGIKYNDLSQVTGPLVEKGIFGKIGNTFDTDTTNLIKNKVSGDTAYQNMDPDIRRQLEIKSFETQTPISTLLKDPKYATQASQLKDWTTVNPNRVATEDPRVNDKTSFLNKNSGIISGIVAAMTGGTSLLSGILGGTATNLAIGGTKNALQNMLPVVAGAGLSNLATSKGLITTGGKAASMIPPPGSVPLTETATGSSGSALEWLTNPTKMASDILNMANPLSAVTPITESTISSALSLFNPAEATNIYTALTNNPLLSNLISDPKVAQTFNKASQNFKKDIAQGKDVDTTSFMRKLFKGDFKGAGKYLITTKEGIAILSALGTGLVSKALQPSSPDYTPPNTGGVDVTSEMVKRLDPSYYGMTQEEKDYLYNKSFDKFQAALGQRNVTRGAVATELSKELQKEIELEDMANKRNLANSAWSNFVNYLGGRESLALQNYNRDMANYNANKASLNDTLAKLFTLAQGDEKQKAPTYNIIIPS